MKNYKFYLLNEKINNFVMNKVSMFLNYYNNISLFNANKNTAFFALEKKLNTTHHNFNINNDLFVTNFVNSDENKKKSHRSNKTGKDNVKFSSTEINKSNFTYSYQDFLKTLQTSLTSEKDTDDTEVGRVVEFKDAVVTLVGLRNIQLNEMVRFEGGASGLILSLEENTARGIVFTGVSSIVVGTKAYRTNSVMVVGVGEALLGRIVNALGEPLDGKYKIAYEDYMQVERKAPGVITRKKVSEPLITGLKIVDAIVPIGRGQRELILGDRKTGKTTIAVDAILNQRLLAEQGESTLICFYVAVGKRLSDVLSIYKTLQQKGASSYTTIVAASASDPASLQYLAPYSACTMAEYFTYKGGHALIVYDDLTKHADAYRQLALLLRRPVGREAYPGDVFYLHSRLLERAVKMNADYLGGSLTALPVVETVQGDVSAYIPTNVISITDGQIYLDLNLHQEGVRPAVDAGLSVSRVGSSAQYKSMKALAGSLKLELAQYREVAQFSKFGSELDAATQKILANGLLLIEILKQPRNLPLVIYKQVLLLYAASSGFLEVLAKNNINLYDYERSLYAFLDTSYIVLPFKRYVATVVDTHLFDFFLYYHYDA